MTPLLFAATGGLFTELAGVLNIALEGLLLAGAFSAIAVTYYTGSLAAGIFASVLTSILLSALLSFSTLKLRSNVFISGLAINLLASGLTIVLSQYFFGTRGVVVVPNIKRIPNIFGHSIFVYASWLLLAATWIVIYKTAFGYRLRACAKHSAALESLGIRPGTYRLAAFLISGLFCGIGGSFLSLNLGAFVPNMTAGKGWIALVVIFLGGRKPQGLIAAAFAFGLAEAFSNYAQGLPNVPAELILAIPYILTLLAMVFVSIWPKKGVEQ
jgi:simple sugar transport system permease protein